MNESAEELETCCGAHGARLGLFVALECGQTPPPKKKLTTSKKCPEQLWVLRALSHGIHVSQTTTPCYRCVLGEWKRGMWSGETGPGQITPTEGPLHSADVSGGCRRREVGLESSCLVRLPQGGHFTEPRHMKCWLVFAGRPEITGEEDRCQGKGEGGGNWPTSSHQAAHTAARAGLFGKTSTFLWGWSQQTSASVLGRQWQKICCTSQLISTGWTNLYSCLGCTRWNTCFCLMIAKLYLSTLLHLERPLFYE